MYREWIYLQKPTRSDESILKCTTGIEPYYLQYPFILIKYLASSPAIFFNRLLPFYAPIPVYESILVLIGNILLQTLLIHTIFFRKKNLIKLYKTKAAVSKDAAAFL